MYTRENIYVHSTCLVFLALLLPTRSEEREVLGVGSIPYAILPSCQYWIIIAQI